MKQQRVCTVKQDEETDMFFLSLLLFRLIGPPPPPPHSSKTLLLAPRREKGKKGLTRPSPHPSCHLHTSKSIFHPLLLAADNVLGLENGLFGKRAIVRQQRHSLCTGHGFPEDARVPTERQKTIM